MARKSIRQNTEIPGQVYSNFSKGMEYNSHSKEASNTRVQYLNNFEIDSDEKLSVRRPLIPHQFKGIEWTSGLTVPAYHTFLKLIHAPFKGLLVPFLWMYKSEQDDSYKLFYRSNGGGTEMINDEDSVNALTEDLNSVFVSGEDILILQGTTFLYKLRFSDAPDDYGFTFEKLTPYVPTLSEVLDSGINLYSNTPLFIENTITLGSRSDVRINSLLPYKPVDQTGYDGTALNFEPDAFSYDAAPQQADYIILKALLDIPINIIKDELKYMFYFEYATKTIKIKDTVRTKLINALQGSLSWDDDDFKKHFPAWMWASDLEKELKPDSGAIYRMPVLVALANAGVTTQTQILDIAGQPDALDYFKYDDIDENTAINFDLHNIISDIGYRVTNRMDLCELGIGSSEARTYKLTIIYDSEARSAGGVEKIFAAEDLEAIHFTTKTAAEDNAWTSVQKYNLARAMDPLVSELLTITDANQTTNINDDEDQIVIEFAGGGKELIGFNYGEFNKPYKAPVVVINNEDNAKKLKTDFESGSSGLGPDTYLYWEVK